MDPDARPSFAALLKAFRVARGLSQEALAERAGRRLDPRGPAVLGMAGTARVELAEAFDVGEADRFRADHLVLRIDGFDPGEMEQRVEQHRGMAGGEDEAVATRPDRIFRIEAQVALPERVGDRGHRHRRSRMSRIGLLHRIDGEGADRIDAQFIVIG